jgi:glycosyltransferase involved in cell wall biosynthesis
MCENKKTVHTRLTDHYLNRERESIRRARLVTASSAAHVNELYRLFPEIRALEIVPLGVGVAKPLAASIAPSDNEPPRFLMVGTFDLRKGTDRIRAAAASYAAQFGPCEIRLISPTPEAELQRMFGFDAPLPPGVTLQYLTNIPAEQLTAEYRSATALLHLARYESFGYPLIEAAAVGTPVVATATGIAEELLTGDLRRLLINGDDAAQCAVAMHLATSQREKLGAALYQNYASAFTREHMTRRYLEVVAKWLPTKSGKVAERSGSGVG